MSFLPSKRGLVLTAAVVSGAVWLLFWGLIQGWYPVLQRSLLVRALNQNLPFVVEVDKVEGSLVDELVLVGLKLRALPEHDRSHTIRNVESLSADRIRLDLDLTRVFEERLVVVRSLEASGVSLSVRQSNAQPDSAPNTTPSTTSKKPEPSENQPFRLKIERVRLREFEIFASWQNELGPGHIKAKGDLTSRDLAWPGDGAGTTPTRFSAEFQVIEGVLGPFELSSGNLKFNGTRELVNVSVDAATARSRDIGLFHTSGSASISLSTPTPTIGHIDARVSFSNLDLAHIEGLGIEVARLPATQLNGELHVKRAAVPDASQGTPSTVEPALSLELSLDPSRLAVIAIDSAHARLDYQIEARKWKLLDARFSASGTRLHASGSGTIDTLDALSLSASRLPIDVIAKVLGLETKLLGHLDLEAELSGALRDPVGVMKLEGAVLAEALPEIDFSLSVRLAGESQYRLEALQFATVEPSKLAFVSDSTARIRRSDDAWVVSNLSLDGPSGRLDIRSAQSDGRQHRLDLEFSSLDLLLLAPFFDGEAPLGGILSGPLAIDLDSDHMRVDADLVLREPQYASFSAETLRLAARTQDTGIRLETEIDLGSESLVQITAELPRDWVNGGLNALGSHPGFSVSVVFDDLPARELEFLLPGELYSGQDERQNPLIAGTLSGVFSAAGSDTGPVVAGTATWTGARFGTAAADQVRLDARTEDGELSVALAISDQGLGGLSADASIDLNAWLEDPASLVLNSNNRASLRADGVDLAWLVPAASARRLGRVKEIEGQATGQLSVEGSREGPRVRGELQVERAHIQLALVDEKIGPIRGHLTFSNNEIRIDQVEIGSKKGPAIATGRYRWNLPTPSQLQLDVDFQNFSLTHFPFLDARVNGALKLAGGLDALHATGDLVFRRVRVTLPAPDDPLFREVRILGLEGDSASMEDSLRAASPSAYQRMQVDIAIEVRPGARILERGADLEADGRFRLRKKPLSPTVLQGILQTTGGTYTFLGRKFDVDEGVASFEERIPPDPELRLVATRRAGDVTVGVEITGRWSDLQSRLISEPEMDDTEILSYLVFDKPSDDVGENDDAELNAAAAQLAGNLALSQLSRAISKDLPVNNISMDVNDDMSVASLGVETNVGDDIILRYDRALQNSAGDRFSVEWKFWKNLSLRSEYENGGTSGLDVFWSYEY